MTVARSLWDRLWAKVDMPVDADMRTCWRWTGAKSRSRNGKLYGYIQEGGRGSRVLRVHRVVCGWYKGPPPTPDHEAGHTCPDGEEGLCCNPHHLEWQTRGENEAQKIDRAAARRLEDEACA